MERTQTIVTVGFPQFRAPAEGHQVHGAVREERPDLQRAQRRQRACTPKRDNSGKGKQTNGSKQPNSDSAPPRRISSAHSVASAPAGAGEEIAASKRVEARVMEERKNRAKSEQQSALRAPVCVGSSHEAAFLLYQVATQGGNKVAVELSERTSGALP